MLLPKGNFHIQEDITGMDLFIMLGSHLLPKSEANFTWILNSLFHECLNKWLMTVSIKVWAKEAILNILNRIGIQVMKDLNDFRKDWVYKYGKGKD